MKNEKAAGSSALATKMVNSVGVSGIIMITDLVNQIS